MSRRRHAAPQIPRADEGRLRAAAPSGEWLPASASTRRLTRGPGPARCYRRHASGTIWDSRSTGITSPAARRSLMTLSCCGRRTDCSRGDQGRDSSTSHRRGAAAALRWYFSHGRRPLAPKESRASDPQRRPRPRLSPWVGTAPSCTKLPGRMMAPVKPLGRAHDGHQQLPRDSADAFAPRGTASDLAGTAALAGGRGEPLRYGHPHASEYMPADL